jgi:hypothetical protein
MMIRLIVRRTIVLTHSLKNYEPKQGAAVYKPPFLHGPAIWEPPLLDASSSFEPFRR